MIEYDKDKIIYLAGIVDGEGHFYRPLCHSGKGHPFYQARIVVVNTHKPLMDWLTDNFGGYVTPLKKHQPHHKQSYQWVISSSKACILASWLNPYLIVKKEQVKRILM